MWKSGCGCLSMASVRSEELRIYLHRMSIEKYFYVDNQKNICYIFASNFKRGALAQSVEQRTENPCVPSPILGGATLLFITIP